MRASKPAVFIMTLAKYLKTVHSFSSVEVEVARKLFSREELKRGTYYLREEQHPQKISFVEQGLFRLFYKKDGQEKVMLFFSEGQFMTDYFGYLTKTTSIRPIQALEDSVIYSIRREDLNELFDRSKKWERAGRILAESAYVTAVLRANRLLHDDIDTRFNTFVQESPSLLQRVPQYMIASYLNMTPETLSRVKKRSMGNQHVKDTIHKNS